MPAKVGLISASAQMVNKNARHAPADPVKKTGRRSLTRVRTRTCSGEHDGSGAHSSLGGGTTSKPRDPNGPGTGVTAGASPPFPLPKRETPFVGSLLMVKPKLPRLVSASWRRFLSRSALRDAVSAAF